MLSPIMRLRLLLSRRQAAFLVSSSAGVRVGVAVDCIAADSRFEAGIVVVAVLRAEVAAVAVVVVLQVVAVVVALQVVAMIEAVVAVLRVAVLVRRLQSYHS